MRELKKNRREIVKGDNSGFPAVSNKKVDHLLYNAQCNLERKKKVCKFYCTTTTGLFFNSVLGINLTGRTEFSGKVYFCYKLYK